MIETSELVVSNESKAAALYLENDDFARVILEFLGKKELLTYKSERGFVASHNDLENFYFLLREKISKEQPFNISHFQVDVNYHDGTTRSLSGIDGLSGFAETRDVTPESVVLSWNVIVKYPQATTIENQKISIFISVNPEIESESNIIVSINHTNMVWAVEVLNLIKTQISKVSHTVSWQYKLSRNVRAFFNNRNTLLIFFMSLYILVMVLMTAIRPEGMLENAESRAVITTALNNGLEQVDTQLALVSLALFDDEGIRAVAEDLKSIELATLMNQAVVSREHYKRKAWGTLAFIILLPISIFVFVNEYVRKFSKTSHILLTSRAKKDMISANESRSMSRFISISAIVGSISCGVITNFIYQYLQ